MAVILLHGFTNTGRSWAPVIGRLGERYRAIAPDIRGHGSASERTPVTLDAVMEDVAGLVDGAFTLVGYSMGARLALHVALALSKRVERLVLIGPTPGIADADERARRREADQRLAAEFEQMTIDAIARRWAANPILAGQPRWLYEDRLRNTPAGLASALRGLGTGALPPLWEQLGELSMQVALVTGERDHKFRRIASEMAPMIADVTVVVVPRAGHAVHLEDPEAVAELISG